MSPSGLATDTLDRSIRRRHNRPMASQQQTVDYLLEQMAGAGAVSARKTFGEYGLHLDGKMFALVCDDRLFM